jgi:hypothetical protein
MPVWGQAGGRCIRTKECRFSYARGREPAAALLQCRKGTIPTLYRRFYPLDVRPQEKRHSFAPIVSFTSSRRAGIDSQSWTVSGCRPAGATRRRALKLDPAPATGDLLPSTTVTPRDAHSGKPGTAGLALRRSRMMTYRKGVLRSRSWGWLAPVRLFSFFWSCSGTAEATVHAVAYSSFAPTSPVPRRVYQPAALP